MFFIEITLLVLYGLCLAFVLGFSLTQFQLTRLARRAYRRGLPPEPAPPLTWPSLTVQLPLYNEVFVAERLIDACAALDYPTDRLHIQVLDDSTDETLELVTARVAYHRAQGLRHGPQAQRAHLQAGRSRRQADGLQLAFIAEESQQ